MSDLPRVLLCSFDVIPAPSGLSRRITEYLKGLPDRFSVVVLSAKTPDHSHIEKYQGARLLRVPVGSGDLSSRIQAFERAVRRQLESEEYALVHFTDPFGGYALCELKGDYGYRLVYEAHSFPSQELRYTHPQLEGDRRLLSKIRRQELFCLMNADVVLTGSITTRAFIHSLGVSEGAVRTIRAPVDLEPYTREVVGEPNSTPLRLLYLGSQVAWQGLAGLLRGVALAARKVDVKLTLVGPRHPDWQPQLDELVNELGLQSRVEFQTPVVHDDLAKLLALSDAGVLTLDDVERNRRQGGSLAKVSEYFAAGRPVIASDLPITRELIPSSAGVFYPPGHTELLAEQIIDLARDVPRRVLLGRAARSLAETTLDARLVRGRLLDLYDGLLGRTSQPAAPSASEPSDEYTSTVMTTVTMATEPKGVVPPSPPAPSPAPKDSPEELPLVMGQVLSGDLDTRLIKTDPAAQLLDELPLVLGQAVLLDSNLAGSVGPGEDEPMLAPPVAASSTPEPQQPSQPVQGKAEPAEAEEEPLIQGVLATSSEPAWPPPPEPLPAPDKPALAAPEEPAWPPPPEPLPDAAVPPPLEPLPDEAEPALAALEEPAWPPPPEPLPPLEEPALAVPLEALPAIAQASMQPVEELPELPPLLAPLPDAATAAPAPAEDELPELPPLQALEPQPEDAAEGELPELPPLHEPASTRIPTLPELELKPDLPQFEPLEPLEPRPAPATPALPPLRSASPVPRERQVPVLTPTAPAPASPARGMPAARPPARPPEPKAPTDSTPVAPVPAATPSAPRAPQARFSSSTPAAAPRPPPLRPSSSTLTSTTLPPRAPEPPRSNAPTGSPRSAPPPLPPIRPSATGLRPTQLPSSPPVLQPTPPLTPRALTATEAEELAEVEPEEVQEEPLELSGEEIEAEPEDDAPREPPASLLDPWLAQLAHGYCPPERSHFTRHTPPTNFPGREESASPSGAPNTARVNGKSS